MVGSLHTHLGCSAELSEWDAEQGQRMATHTGLPYFVFVIGPDNDTGENITMTQELFYPEDPEIMLARRLEV
jgi:proteasome lid subunit RPN8/RPN11